MIFPKPQKCEFRGDILLKTIPEIFTGGAFSDYALLFLEKELPENRIGSLDIHIMIEDCYESVYIEKTQKISDEKYRIEINEDGNCNIKVSCRRGLFRALCTLSKLLKQYELRAGLIEDYPLFEKRGYIEGFYGSVWSHDVRTGVMKLMANHGMNTFYYAPKDDQFHRAKWRELYPENKLSNLKELIETSLENEMDFNYCIAPGLSMRYSNDGDFNTLMAKIKSVYDIGVRHFGLLLDDISEELQYPEDKEKYGETVNAHIALINRTYNELIKLDRNIQLTVCPLQYHGKGNEYFISKLGRSIEPQIDIFWTGSEICSREINSLEAVKFIEGTRHKPLYWDNYPVNDAEMFNEMHLGPIQGRESDLYRYSSGLISNVMEYGECSKIPLLTIADYLWNPEQYNRDESYNYAVSAILGEKADLFGYFSDHLQVSCLTKHSSAFMSETLSRAMFLFESGKQLDAASLLTDYIDKCNKCAQMLKDNTVPLFTELVRWADKYEKCCEILKLCFDVLCSGDEDTKDILLKKSDEYDKDATLLTGFCLREAVQKVLQQ